MFRKTLVGAVVAALVAVAATAGAQERVRVRGTIEKVDGPVYIVKARDGSELKVTLADNALVVAIIKASLSDIKVGSFVGITALPQADGTQKAVEVHIFPESMRGTGEGHYPWDLQPKSTMTNANVEQMVTGVDGQTLTLKHKDGETKIIVPPDVPVVTYAKGDKEDLKPGTKIFIAFGNKQPDGSVQAPRINYGKDGLTPPM
jgi:outer membrane lipoprotein SlyB